MIYPFSKLRAARKALLFYADREVYRRKGVHPQGSPVRYKAAPIVRDHGSHARLALREMDRPSLLGRLFRSLFKREAKRVVRKPPQVPAPLKKPLHEDVF